jgi:hypothetical protein
MRPLYFIWFRCAFHVLLLAVVVDADPGADEKGSGVRKRQRAADSVDHHEREKDEENDNNAFDRMNRELAFAIDDMRRQLIDIEKDPNWQSREQG